MQSLVPTAAATCLASCAIRSLAINIVPDVNILINTGYLASSLTYTTDMPAFGIVMFTSLTRRKYSMFEAVVATFEQP